MQWLGAVQAQEYAGAKWGIAQRARGITDAALDQAFADGKILRTHVLRPTWHFVAPADIRWMLELTAPRVYALNAYYYRQLELDDAIFARSHALLAKALQGGKQLTRQELTHVLQGGGINTSGLRLPHLFMHAELDAVICSGALRGKQHTYALLSERAPQAKTLTHDESLAELARRYFASHGPATLKDYIWWSGLSAADANAGLELIKPQFVHEVVDGKEYWFSPSMPGTQDAVPASSLLSVYDEYIIAYTNRAAFLFDPLRTSTPGTRADPLAGNPVLMKGYIVGTWKRTIKKNTIIVEIHLSTPLHQAEIHARQDAVECYSRFTGMPVISSYNDATSGGV